MKICKICKQEKSHKEFDKAYRNTDNYENRCRSCKLTQARNLRQRYPEKYYNKTRKYDLNRRYGIKEEDYIYLLQKQDGKCAICRRGNPGRKTSKVFHIDHDHNTGTIRGLLCHPCNVNLGWAERYKIQEYLEKYNEEI